MRRALMPKQPLVIFAVFLLTACYGPPETVSLSQNADLLDGRLVRAVPDDREFFSVWTHGRSGLNVEVFKFLDAAGIEDPATVMEAALARHLVERAGAKSIGSPLAFDPNKPDDLIAWARDRAVTDILIDVETKNWGFEWWSSSVKYEAIFRLIDPVSGRILAQHLCDLKSPTPEYGPETPQNPFPEDDVSRALLADNAAPIKAIVSELAEACLQDVKSAAL